VVPGCWLVTVVDVVVGGRVEVVAVVMEAAVVADLDVVAVLSPQAPSRRVRTTIRGGFHR